MSSNRLAMKWSVLLGALALSSCETLAITIVSPSQDSTVRLDSMSILFELSGESGNVSYVCTLDGQPFACSPTRVGGPFPPPIGDRLVTSVNGLRPGPHTVVISATDSTGNTGSASVRFVMDEIMKLTMTAPELGEWLTTPSTPLAFATTGENGAVSFTCQLDRTPPSACSSPRVYSGLAEGTHTLRVTARDGMDTATRLAHVLVATAGQPALVPVSGIAVAPGQSCAVLNTGKVRCWGFGSLTPTCGECEKGFPASVPDVDVGAVATRVSAGPRHACALLTTGKVRCWGENWNGAVGYWQSGGCLGSQCIIGDDETPASAGDVNVGADVAQIVVGGNHTCARLTSGKVRCWGEGTYGALGYGNPRNIGDDEAPASAGDVQVGGTVQQLAAGYDHTCALLTSGKVRCWGEGQLGTLGYGNSNDVGDDETPASAGDVNVGGAVVQIAAGGRNTCALLATGQVRCWGSGGPVLARAGYQPIGDDETPASAAAIDVGGTVKQIVVGGGNACVLLNNGKVRCWGNAAYGSLGYGNENDIGDDETPASAGDVDVGGSVTELAAGDHVCALLDSKNVRCWGQSSSLGYGNDENVGDDETPASVGDVLVAFSGALSTE